MASYTSNLTSCKRNWQPNGVTRTPQSDPDCSTYVFPRAFWYRVSRHSIETVQGNSIARFFNTFLWCKRFLHFQSRILQVKLTLKSNNRTPKSIPSWRIDISYRAFWHRVPRHSIKATQGYFTARFSNTFLRRNCFLHFEFHVLHKKLSPSTQAQAQIYSASQPLPATQFSPTLRNRLDWAPKMCGTQIRYDWKQSSWHRMPRHSSHKQILERASILENWTHCWHLRDERNDIKSQKIDPNIVRSRSHIS